MVTWKKHHSHMVLCASKLIKFVNFFEFLNYYSLHCNYCRYSICFLPCCWHRSAPRAYLLKMAKKRIHHRINFRKPSIDLPGLSGFSPLIFSLANIQLRVKKMVGVHKYHPLLSNVFSFLYCNQSLYTIHNFHYLC